MKRKLDPTIYEERSKWKTLVKGLFETYPASSLSIADHMNHYLSNIGIRKKVNNHFVNQIRSFSPKASRIPIVPSSGAKANAFVYALVKSGLLSSHPSDNSANIRRKLVESLGYDYDVYNDSISLSVTEYNHISPNSAKENFRSLDEARKYCNNTLYETAVGQLRGIFESSKFETQGEVIRGLESLIGRFSEKKQDE